MRFDNAVVVQPDSFTEGVLGDLEPTVDVPTQGRGEVEPDGEGQRIRTQALQQCLFLWRSGEGEQELLPHMELVRSSG